MKTAPIPDNEIERLKSLYCYALLDTPPDPDLDELTRLAATVCKTPIATITLIDRKREWYKSKYGIDDREAARDISFCAYTILGKELFIVNDTLKDDRFKNNPFVTDDPPLRFYAGAPLINPDGYALGTLCVIDHRPRRLNREQKQALQILACQITNLFELQKENHSLKEQQNITDPRESQQYSSVTEELARLSFALECSGTGTWEWNIETNKVIWNREHQTLFGYEPGTFHGTFQEFSDRIHPDDFPALIEAVEEAKENKTQYHREFRITHPDGKVHWLESIGRFMYDGDGRPLRMLGIVLDITDRKYMEENLRFASFALDKAADGIYWLKPDASIFYVNDSACRMLGYTREELLNMTVLDVNPDMTKDRWKARWEKNKKKSCLFIETCHKTRDGNIIPVEITANHIEFEGNEYNCSIVRNISERKRIEQEKNALLERNAFLVNALGEIVYDWWPKEDKIYWEGNYTNILGYTKKEMGDDTQSWIKRIHPEDIDRVLQGVEIAKKTGRNVDLQYRFLHRDGNYLWMHDSGVITVDENNEIDRILGVFVDITEHKQAQLALRESEARYRTLVEHAPDIIVVLDTDSGKFIDMNKNAENFFKFSRQSLMNMGPNDLSPEFQPNGRNSSDLIDTYIKQALKGETPVFEWLHHDADGKQIYCEVRLVRFPASDRNILRGSVIDITERKRAGDLLTVEKNALEMIAAGHDISEVLYTINTGIEKLLPGSMCSILLLDKNGKKLYHASAPSLPKSYNDAIDGLEIGPETGSCGTAAFLNKRVIVSDINNNSLWSEYCELAAEHNLRSCWSTPIHSSSDRILGTFAIYFSFPTEPSLLEDELISRMSQLAGIAIEKDFTTTALIESEEKFRSIVETTTEWIWERDLEGDLTYSNNTLEEILGYQYEDYCGTNTFEFVHPEDRNNIKKKFRDYIEERRGWKGWIIRWVHKNGDHRYTESNAIPVFNHENKLIGFRGSDRDITERILAHAALRESEMHLRDAQKIAQIGSWKLNICRNVLYWSDETFSIFGEDPDKFEATYEAFFKFVHPDDREKMQIAQENAIKGLKQLDIIHRICRLDNTIRYVHERGRIITSEDGVNYLVGTVQDITHRVEAERVLRRNEAMLQEAQHVAHMGSWEMDHKLQNVTWSDELYRIFEVDKDTFRVSNESFLDVVLPDDREQVDTAFRVSVKKRSNYDINYRLLMPDGRVKYINEKCRTYYDENGNPLRSVGTTINYTKEKLAEIELKAKARQQQFIARLGRLSLSQKSLTEIFDIAVEGLAKILDVEYSKILELQPDAKQFILVAGHGFEKGMIGRTIISAGFESQAGYTLNQNKPVVVDDINADPRFKGPELLVKLGIISGVSVVIEGRDRPYGVLGVHTINLRKFSRHDVDFVQAVAVILAEAIENEFVSSQILSSRQRLRNLAIRLQAVREEERTRISQEIHDELGQTLTGLRIDLASIYKELQEDNNLSGKVYSALQLADSTLDTVRRISHDLRPPILDDLGLEAAIEWQVEEFRRYSHCQCDLEIKVGAIGIQSERDTIVFRILQEALTNVARHANADSVNVSLLNSKGRLILTVADNGIGINKTSIDSNESIGLIGMRERAGTLGGDVEIHRLDEGGTFIKLVIPYAKRGTLNT